MKPIGRMKQAELAAFIQSSLSRLGIEVVLCGGASVAVYTDNQYVSADIDLVNVASVPERRLSDAMRSLGFQREGRHFRHPDSSFIVEFPPGPLAVGREPVGRVDEIRLTTGVLKIVSPTDCVKDRLAAYFHWNDLQCLEQAVMVGQAHPIDLEELRRWSVGEGKGREFSKLESDLTPRRSKPRRK